jgi:hypothetical protein
MIVFEAEKNVVHHFAVFGGQVLLVKTKDVNDTILYDLWHC